jgi:hypothetical protein
LADFGAARHFRPRWQRRLGSSIFVAARVSVIFRRSVSEVGGIISWMFGNFHSTFRLHADCVCFEFLEIDMNWTPNKSPELAAVAVHAASRRWFRLRVASPRRVSFLS